MRSLPRMAPGVCEIEEVEATGSIYPTNGSLLGPRQYRMPSERHRRPAERFNRDFHLRTDGTCIINVGLCALRDLGDKFSVRRVNHTGE